MDGQITGVATLTVRSGPSTTGLTAPPNKSKFKAIKPKAPNTTPVPIVTEPLQLQGDWATRCSGLTPKFNAVQITLPSQVSQASAPSSPIASRTRSQKNSDKTPVPMEIDDDIEAPTTPTANSPTASVTSSTYSTQSDYDMLDQANTPNQQASICTTPPEEALVPSERGLSSSQAITVHVATQEHLGSPKSLRRENSSSSVTATLAGAALDGQVTTPRVSKQPRLQVSDDTSSSSLTTAFTTATTTTTTTTTSTLLAPPQSPMTPTAAPPTPKQSAFKPIPNQVLVTMGQAQQTLTRNAHTHRKEVLLELKKLDFTFRRHTEALEALLSQIGGNLTTLKHKVTTVNAKECTKHDQDDFTARNGCYAQERGLLLHLKARLSVTHSLLGQYIEAYKGSFAVASGGLDELERKCAIYRKGLDQLQLAWALLRKEWQRQQRELKTGIDDLDQLDRETQGKLRELHTKVTPKDTEALKWLDVTPEIVLKDQPIAPEVLAGPFPLIDAIDACQNQVLTRADTDNALNLKAYTTLDVTYQQQAQEIAALQEKLTPLLKGLKTQVEALETTNAVATEADIGVCNEKSLDYVNLSDKLIKLRAKIEYTRSLIEHNRLAATIGIFDTDSPNVAEVALKLKINIQQVTAQLLPAWSAQAGVWVTQYKSFGDAVVALNGSDWVIRDLLVRFKHRLAPEPTSVYGVYTWVTSKLPGAYHSPFAYVAIPQTVAALQRQVQGEKKTEEKE